MHSQNSDIHLEKTGLIKKNRYTDIEMRPGDAFVMAGASRMIYHGVLRIFPPHQPSVAGLDNTVRHSISVRQAMLHI